MRQVKQQAPHRRITAEDAGKSRADAAADVGQGPDARQVVGVEHRLRFSTAEVGHGGVKDPGLLGVFGQIVEDRPAVQAFEGRLAGADGLEQVAPAAILLLAQHDRKRPQGFRSVRAEGRGQRIKAEPPVVLPGEDANAGQGAEDPVQRPRCRAGRGGRGGELLGRPRAVRQKIGDLELRGDVDRP